MFVKPLLASIAFAGKDHLFSLAFFHEKLDKKSFLPGVAFLLLMENFVRYYTFQMCEFIRHMR